MSEFGKRMNIDWMMFEDEFAAMSKPDLVTACIMFQRMVLIQQETIEDMSKRLELLNND